MASANPTRSCFLLKCTGCVVPELLDGTNHIAWFKAGEQIFTKQGIQYLGINGFINAHSIIATLIVQVCTTLIWRRCSKKENPFSVIAKSRRGCRSPN